jgi:hypothetical protein
LTDLTENTILTLDEAAAHLRVTTRWLANHAGEWGGVKLGKYWRFIREKIDGRLSEEADREMVLRNPPAGGRQEYHGSGAVRLRQPRRRHPGLDRGQAALGGPTDDPFDLLSGRYGKIKALGGVHRKV